MSENVTKAAPMVEMDKNMVVETKIAKDDIKFFSVKDKPFKVYGMRDFESDKTFRRLPDEVAEATSTGVTFFMKECAGGRIRFSTDSPYVAISVEYKRLGRNSHTPLIASAGFDLYEDYPEGIFESRYIATLIPPYDSADRYEQIRELGEKKLRYFTINMPLHSTVENVYVGIADGSYLGEGAKYRNELPVIIYGSSIVHGTGPSRPGLTYANIISRRMNLNITNLGFSGAAKGEDPIVDYMIDLPMSVFISDYDHNAPSAEALSSTHLKMYKKFREKNPTIPYIIISRPDVAGKFAVAEERRRIIFDTFRYAKEAGDKNVYYIDGESFFLGSMEYDCTVDTTHPNDHGNFKMADSIEWVLRRIMMKDFL